MSVQAGIKMHRVVSLRQTHGWVYFSINTIDFGFSGSSSFFFIACSLCTSDFELPVWPSWCSKQVKKHNNTAQAGHYHSALDAACRDSLPMKRKTISETLWPSPAYTVLRHPFRNNSKPSTPAASCHAPPYPPLLSLLCPAKSTKNNRKWKQMLS